ncbi:MAG: hypothetical protein B7Y87_02020 [Sphingomonadales bacterium 32-64-22]|nr:MAG: hypothetical protein B7Y87_02020 [Sphingomonadales bacterium 32-64-22]
MKPILTLACTVLAVAVATPAFASEKGGGAYPNGAEALAIAALPPPGDYLINYSNYYNADRLNDSDGHSSVPDFSIDAFANVFRYIHVTDRKILGASWAQQVFVPVVDLTVHAAGQRGHRFGVGDVIVDPFILGWHFKNNWHVVAAVDTWVPVGSYNRDDLANIGRNYWTFEPVLTASHFNPAGGPEVSVKLMYDFNTRNKATDYRTGQEFHTDFAVAYNFNPVTIGLNGYYYKQTTDDKQNGVRVGDDGYKGETLALGPVVRYQAGKVPISFQYQHEMFAHNRPQGDNFWLKAAFRF